MSKSIIRTDIQALRAIAVVAVVIAHSKLFLQGGFVGVDMFFVISGFLITLNLCKELAKTGTVSIKDFYARRILRILPAALFTLFATFFVSFFFLSPVQLLSNLYDGLASLFSVLNFRFAANSTNYFANAEALSPFQHFWSLCVEEQFYIFWPLLIIFSTKLLKGKFSNRAILNTVLFFVISFSLVLSYFVTNSSPSWAYFGLHTRAWELAIGALIAVNNSFFEKFNLGYSKIISYSGLVILAASFIIINDKTPFPSYWALLPTVGTALIICAGNLKDSLLQKIFSSKILQYVGNISYSWYLVHWPIFVLLFYIYGKDINYSLILSGIVFSFILAIFSYNYIEQPFRSNTFLKTNIYKPYKFALVAVSILSFVFVLSINALSKNELGSTKQQVEDIETLNKKIDLAVKQNLIPTQLTLQLSKIGEGKYPGCFSERATPVIEEEMVCELGDTKSSKVAIMIGDSHAWQWTKAWSNIAKLHNFKLLTFTKSSCPMQDIRLDYTACVNWKKQVFERITGIKPDIIIAGGMTYGESTPQNYSEYLSNLKKMASRVIVIQDTPYPTLNVPECLAKNIESIQNCSFERNKAYFANSQRQQDKETAVQSGLRVVDPIDWFCSDKICPPIIDDVFVYFDVNHISTAYADYVTKLLDEKVKDGFK